MRLWHLMLLTVLAAVLATTAVRTWVVDVYTVDQNSMQPTLDDGERILVDRSYPGSSGADRGDVVVFDGTGSFTPYQADHGALVELAERAGHWFGIGSPPQTYVKRVIGVGGDTVACCDEQGRVTVDGEPLEEPYLGWRPSPEEPASEQSFDVEVPPGRLWVMGDNRDESVDSRALLGAPGGGMISEDRLIGRATDVFWPWSARRDLAEDSTSAADPHPLLGSADDHERQEGTDEQ
ncbi:MULTISPECIES: signal peptidase I [unclassified Nesterenkonia]|uniref:signal peptidase I n=1 Tax=unclassified Nesterenkonia TaxID=2629769 RepID=UPI000871DF4D|nr:MULTISPECIES: signal peptidase I [unclassified Nesterenkonia]MDS2172419.1 signal peptidase I [Nesterenkonia sp. CL21]